MMKDDSSDVLKMELDTVSKIIASFEALKTPRVHAKGAGLTNAEKQKLYRLKKQKAELEKQLEKESSEHSKKKLSEL